MAGGLDHLVIVARDLDAQAVHYKRLGFKVGACNRHDWGTLNRIVQFDGCFLELLTTEAGFQTPPATSAVGQFARPIADYLAKREGLAMMVLEGFDAASDHKAFQDAGIGMPETFYFARQGRRPDGELVEVAFSLAFARTDTISDAGFFVCQQHAPEMFWNPAFQVHPNGATGINRIVFVSDEPSRHDAFFSAYTGVEATHLANGGMRYDLARGAVDVMTPIQAGELYGEEALPGDLTTAQFAAIEFSIDNLARTTDVLEAGAVPFARTPRRATVSAREAMGVTLAFVEAA